MNTNEKKIFFSVFTFNLLIFIAVMAIVVSIIFTMFGYLAEAFPIHNDNILLMSKLIIGIVLLLSLAKIKPLYVDTKKTTLRYINSVKED